MKILTKKELQLVLIEHQKWLTGDEGKYADLKGIDLSDTDLSSANLSGIDLSDFDLSRTDLTYTSLINTNLSNTNLDRADLYNCAGNRKEIKSLFISELYPITYTAEILQIGCERHTFAEWWGFSDDEIRKMDGSKAVEFWHEFKELILITIEKAPAVPTK